MLVRCIFVVTTTVVLALQALAASPTVIVAVKNPIELARPSETIVLDATKLQQLLSLDDVRKIHVVDTKSGQELLIQAVDTNDDGKFDEFLFQADLMPQESRKFTLSVGVLQTPRREDFKTYARFVRERRDDFAWENDRIAHRTYGAALETWPQEPLTSSAIDVWTKRVRKLVINDWYMMDNYHEDHGEGGDFYSAGSSRGCGGSGVWAGDKLFPSANFRDSRVLANGPIRLMFELTYSPWEAGGVRVSETKRITLDAGHNLDRFESDYKVEEANGRIPALFAAGIKISPKSAKVSNLDSGTLRTWEPLKIGELGCGVVADPKDIASFTEDGGNYLVVIKGSPAAKVTYYAGFGWNQSADFQNVSDWDRYLMQYARRLQAPVQIAVAIE